MRFASLFAASFIALATSGVGGHAIDEAAVAGLNPQASELRFDNVTPDVLTAAADRQLAAAKAILDRLVAVEGPRTIENTLQPYDELFQLQNAVFNFLTIVHRDPSVRAAAAKEFGRLRAFRVALNQDRRVYDALAGVDLRQAGGETRHYVQRVLNNLRDNAVDRDEPTRRKLADLQAEILRLEQEFAGNLRTRGVNASFTAAELDGVPADWLASQTRGPNGDVIVGQGMGFVMRFARNPDVRDRAMMAMHNAAKANHETLTKHAAMTTARDIFGLEFRPVTDAPVWDPTVETYDAYDGGQRIGRLYLDTVIRPGITVPTATHPIRSGLKGKGIVEVAITAPMKRATPGEPNLLDPMGVTSLFHEMGHAIHQLLSARKWAGTSGQVVERDFTEVPSNFFTEWSRDPRVVKSMARHYKTGEPMPAELLAMIQTSDDNQNMFRLPVAHWQARLSLALHNQPTLDVDVDAVVRQTMAEYLPYQPPTGEIHPEASFSHLQGYGAAYYTYLWSAVIAKDFEQQFGGDLFNKKVAMRYRQTILEGGRSAPAAKLVENFLGRPFSVKPWGDWVAKTK